jgi:hypothetical protein
VFYFECLSLIFHFQTSELMRFPTTDSHSFDESFFQDMLHRGPSARTSLQPDWASARGNGRKTYLDDALQNEVRSSTGGSLGTSMFSKRDEAGQEEEEEEEDEAINVVPGIQRSESVVYGASDEDGLSIGTDVLNTTLIRGSSFVSMLSTTSSMGSHMSLMSPLTLGSAWSNFSPRGGGESKSRLPPSNVVPQLRLARAVSDKPVHHQQHHHQLQLLTLQRAVSDPIYGTADDAAEDAKLETCERSEEEYSFSLTRQNSSNEIVENHDSSVDEIGLDGCDAADVGMDDCCNVEDDYEESDYSSKCDEREEINGEDDQDIMSLTRPSHSGLQALMGLHIDTEPSLLDGNSSGLFSSAEEEDEEGNNMHLAPLSESEASSAIVWAATPLSSTMSVLNRGFFAPGVGSADAEDGSNYQSYSQLNEEEAPSTSQAPPRDPANSTAVALANLKARLHTRPRTLDGAWLHNIHIYIDTKSTPHLSHLLSSLSCLSLMLVYCYFNYPCVQYPLIAYTRLTSTQTCMMKTRLSLFRERRNARPLCKKRPSHRLC